MVAGVIVRRHKRTPRYTSRTWRRINFIEMGDNGIRHRVSVGRLLRSDQPASLTKSLEQGIDPANAGKSAKVEIGCVDFGIQAHRNRSNLCIGGQVARRACILQ